MRRLLAGLVLVMAFAAACEDQPPEPSSGEVTLEAAVAAMAREGQVFYAEWVFPAEGDQVPRMKAWYWPERELVRTEFHDQEAHRSTSIVSRQGEVRHDIDDGSLSDDRNHGRQWDPGRGGIAGMLPHIGYWAAAPGALGELVEVHDGELLRVHVLQVAEQDAHERPKGTTHTFDIFLDPASLLPAHVTVAIDYPNRDDGDVEPYTIKYVTTEFVEEDDLPTDFFDQDKLGQ